MVNFKVPSEEDRKILRKQLQLLSAKSERAGVSDLVKLSIAMANIEAIIIGHSEIETYQPRHL